MNSYIYSLILNVSKSIKSETLMSNKDHRSVGPSFCGLYLDNEESGHYIPAGFPVP